MMKSSYMSSNQRFKRFELILSVFIGYSQMIKFECKINYWLSLKLRQ